MGTIIDCKKYVSDVKLNIKDKVERYHRAYLKRPRCLIVNIGDNEASKAYIRGKLKDFGEIGIESQLLKLDKSIEQSVAVHKIQEMLELFRPDGVIVQLPIPKHLDIRQISNLYKPTQDIDGFKENSTFRPCTPDGIVRLLKTNNIAISGKHAVVIGRSNIVGRPLADMLLESDATVTICHSKTQNLGEITKQADILIPAAGVQDLVKPDMIKEGVVLVDVGINRNPIDNKIAGDISKDCYDKSSRYTIVPGGIGLVTRVTLCENIISAYELRNIKK